MNNPDLQPGMIELGGIDVYRAITKIAINYSLYKGFSVDSVTEAIDFLKVKKEKNDVARFYYPSNYNIYELKPDDISHFIFLKADFQYKILYCYLELFSTFNFIVVLNKNYEGEDTEFFDGKNLITNESFKKNIYIKLTRQHFLDLLEITESKSMIDARFNKYDALMRKFERIQTPPV